MLNGISSYNSVSALSATTSVATTKATETSQETAAVSANYDSYTVSDEAKVAMAMSEEAPEVEDTTTDVEVEDTDTDVEVEDTNTDVDVEEEVEEELDDGVEDYDDLMNGYNDQYNAISTADMKLTMMANQMNTFTTMMSVMNGDEDVNSASWINDAMTFSYAGKYLAKSADGSRGVQQNQSVDGSTERAPVEYNTYSTTEREDALSYDEILEKYEAEDSSSAFDAMMGK